MYEFPNIDFYTCNATIGVAETAGLLYSKVLDGQEWARNQSVYIDCATLFL